MKHFKITFLLFTMCLIHTIKAQENNNDYIEFNDKKNTVHGVYLGIAGYYGTINKKDTYSASVKLAYVANKQFEVGFAAVGFYTDENGLGLSETDNDIIGTYGGLHLEPILFSKSKLNLSFPVLIGAGAVNSLKENLNDDFEIIDDYEDDWDAVFVIEPGLAILYNINRYIQLETFIKHRFSSKLSFENTSIERINGFSGGIGIKVGVFNMGKGRYKKEL